MSSEQPKPSDMVVMGHGARSTGFGASVPAQAELQMVDAALRVPGCQECPGSLPEEGRDGLLCRKCAAVEELSPSGKVREDSIREDDT